MSTTSKRTRVKFTCKVNFYLKGCKPANKLTSIRCFVSYNNDRHFIQNIAEIEPKYWNKKAKRPRLTSENDQAKLFKRLDNIEKWLESSFEETVDRNGAYPDPADFKLKAQELIRYNGELPIKEVEKPITFLHFIQELIDDTKSGKRVLLKGPRAGQPYAPRTHLHYGTTLNLLKKYVQHSGRGSLDFSDIDLDFYHDFKQYLFEVEEVSDNYFGNQIKNIKLFLSEALEKELHTNIKHKSSRFVKLQSDSDTIYLDPEKLNYLFKLDLSANTRLERVRDLFLVGCWTGLRFSDFTNIKATNIHGDTIDIKTQKTGRSVAIPIHDTVQEIMKRYAGKTENSLPPGMSNQKLNLYLKELMQYADATLFASKGYKGFRELVQITKTKGGKKIIFNQPFHELVSTHSARRSFATNMFKMQVPSIVIMGITGHSTEKAFLKYIKVTPNEKAEMLREIWNRQEMKAI